MLAAGVRVIDIREDHEVAGGMVSGAEHIAMSHLLTAAGDGTDERLSARALDGAVLYCAAGTRSGSTDRKSTRLNSSHVAISYAVFCLKKKKNDLGDKRHRTK